MAQSNMSSVNSHILSNRSRLRKPTWDCHHSRRSLVDPDIHQILKTDSVGDSEPRPAFTCYCVKESNSMALTLCWQLN